MSSKSHPDATMRTNIVKIVRNCWKFVKIMSKNVHFPETLQMTYIPKFWQQISNKICTFPKQKPSKLHTFSNPAPEGRPETLQITYIPKVLASYIQYFLIFLDFFANLVNFWKFVLKVAFWCDFEDRIFGPKIPYNICPQSRLSSKSHVLKVVCPQSRVLKVVSSTSHVLIVP